MNSIGGTPFPDMFEREEVCDKKRCLLQGDIIKITKGECDFFDKQEGALGYLVISNTCDLEHNDLKTISVVPIFSFKLLLKNFLDDKTQKINKKREKELSEGRTYDAKAELESVIANMILDEANYYRKSTFFISPLEKFDNLPTIALLDDIRSIELKSTEILLKNRICSMKAPWREKLGHKVGYLFNRVSTFTPDRDEIRTWWIKAYSEEYSEALSKI